MSTVDKDFKVKNGIQVAGSAVVGGTVTASDPTLATHVATKNYVDSIALPTVDSTAPESADAGRLWLDTLSGRLHIYDGSEWIALATVADANELPQHIHDTAIDGTGFVVTRFEDAGYFDSAGNFVDAGQADTNSWQLVFDGGIAIDNFN